MVCIIAISCTDTVSPKHKIHDNSAVYIKYINAKGEDLLNPKHPHAITEQNTNLYYLINGQKKKIYKGNLASPKMFNIGQGFDTTSTYSMQLYANTPDGQHIGITYITFKDYSTDTLKVHYKTTGGIAVDTVWYNEKLRYDKEIYQQNKYPKELIVVTKQLSTE